MYIDQSNEIGKVSSLAGLMKNDRRWLLRQKDPSEILETLEIDREIAALDICIYLTRMDQYVLAETLLKRLREKFPGSPLTLRNSAMTLAGMRNYEDAIICAQRAIAISPGYFATRSLLIKAYALSGAPEKARNALRGMQPVKSVDREACTVLSQFVDLCAEFPLSGVRSAMALLHESGSHYDSAGCAELILSAVNENRPFSFVRLGDGEGSWLSLEPYDEGRYSALYRENRIGFLNDWFGNDSFIDDEDFWKFSKQIQSTYFEHDLIGINPAARIDKEESLLSIRGITSIVNTVRFLDLASGSKRGLATCSNAVNRGLASVTNFYRDLFAMPRPFGIITSHAIVRDKLIERGVDVTCSYITPGDSRNFHLSATGQPECQYPHHVERIDAELASMDLRGTVFLVAAGFVGKRYLSTIKRRGGIAIDLGSMTDHWAKNGLP